ncbi:MAG: phosphoglycerate mutase family protein [Bacteroidales bacterium]|jgi:hypothetical protein|nr:phosphoglycerate mutase family protein [Bacteroidales bacterium]
MDVLEISQRNQQIAWNILEKSQMIRLWESIGGKVNIVGSLKTGLLIHRDIDLHIYTENLSITDSFLVVGKLAEQLALKDIQYKNLIDTEEECIEWHAIYEDEEANSWKFDMIHIRKNSRYDGVVEKVTDAIIRKLTPEIREAILRIKYDMHEDEIIPGIEVYKAVFTGKVRSYQEFMQWHKKNPLTNSLEWMP